MASLYRKWRSRSFLDLVGQEHVVRTLRHAVRDGRMAHAYLFTGPRGTGKTSTARILAKAVNCRRPVDGNPCGECDMCRAADEGRAIDVIEIDAASNTSVEHVRDLRERVAYAAGEGKYKVYIVDEVHRLSGAAFDAFLKTLEEPPPHVIFVFASTEPHKVPPTITSRCQRFDFRRHSPGMIADRLRFVAGQERIQVSEQALQLIAVQARGSLRDALGILEQVSSYSDAEISDVEVREALGLAGPTLVALLTDHLVDHSIGSGLTEFHRFLDEGGDARQLGQQFLEYWRALLLAVTGAGRVEASLDPGLRPDIARHAGALDEQQVLAAIRALVDLDFGSRFNVPPELGFEMGYVQAGLRVGGAKRSASVVAPAHTPDPPPESRPPAAPAEVLPAEDEHAVAAARSTATAPDARFDEAPAPPPGGPLDIEMAWPSIVAGMRSRSPSLQAVLRSGYLLRVDGGEITIGFEFDFHRDQFKEVKKRKLLEEVVGEVLGTTYRVTCVKTTKDEIKALRGPEAARDDDGFVEEVAERLRQFHAKQLGNGHS